MPVLIAEILFSYFVSIQIKNGRKKGIWLFAGIASISAILLFFKYAGLLGLSDFLSGSHSVIIPLGLSYYSFKIISFLIDTYNGKIGDVSFVEYFAYIGLFTQIISGPISRPDEVIPQLRVWELKYDDENFVAGVEHILSGLFKKFVIAERLSGYTSKIFTGYKYFPSVALWLAAIFFSIQLYCDFAGYSEIAIGVGELISIKCSPNFLRPYFSADIREFWTRWHISLSSWLKDYIYIPLGGNRYGNVRKIINLLLTFLVSGIWHGAGLNFIVWGMYNGILVILSPKKEKRNHIIHVIITFILSVFGWIIFNSKSVFSAFDYIRHMFCGFEIKYQVIVNSILPFTEDYSSVSYFIIIVISIILLFADEFLAEKGVDSICKWKMTYVRCTIYTCFLIVLGTFGTGNFIYANF